MKSVGRIHDHIKEKVGLAQIYAEDGAFRSAARILRELADDLDAHMDSFDEALSRACQPREARHG